jgi:hypothetical protein
MLGNAELNSIRENPTFELMRRRDSKHRPPDQSSCETRPNNLVGRDRVACSTSLAVAVLVNLSPDAAISQSLNLYYSGHCSTTLIVWRTLRESTPPKSQRANAKSQ